MVTFEPLKRSHHGHTAHRMPMVGVIQAKGFSEDRDVIRRVLREGCAQTKLAVGTPDDIYEQEADRVSDAVMRMPEPPGSLKPT